MSDLWKTILKIAGLVFGALLIGFTGYETFSFLLAVTQNPILAAIGLIMFEGGFLYWALAFMKGSEGLIQMAVSLITSVLCLLGVVVAVAANLEAVDLTGLNPALPSMVIVAMVIVNLIAKYIYTLSGPDTMHEIMKRAAMGNLLKKTFTAFSAMTDDIAQDTANEMATTWKNELRHAFDMRFTALSGQANHPHAGEDPQPPDYEDIQVIPMSSYNPQANGRTNHRPTLSAAQDLPPED